MLSGGQMCAEDGDRRHANLVEPHNIPRALDNAEALVEESCDSVIAVEDLAFWQTFWELPLAVRGNQLAVQAAACVAERVSGEVVEPDANAALKEAESGVDAGLK